MLAALAFNDADTPIMSAQETGECISNAFRKLITFSPFNDEEKFQSKSSFIRINGLCLSAVSANGYILETENDRNITLVLPLTKENCTTIEGVHYSYSAGHTGFFAICEKQKTITLGSSMAIHFKPDKALSTYQAITGSKDIHVLPKTSQVTSLDISNICFLEIFKTLFAQIDAVRVDINMLGKLAIDDSLYRLSATLICPEILLLDDIRHGKRPYVRPELNRLCEYIAAHLTRGLSLTEMESVSGLSARFLQRSFQNAFNMTPKQWVRKQRLHAARRVMLNRRESISVTALAYDFCFASPSDFAHRYALEFGEKPSQTLGRINFDVSSEHSVEFKNEGRERCFLRLPLTMPRPPS